jgi:putative ABC transport system permease protein
MSKHSSPPRFAEWLVRHASGAEEPDVVAGDFREAFDERAASLGVDAAKRWYWAETLRSLLPLLRRRWHRSTSHRASRHAADPMWTSLVADARYALRLSRRAPLASTAVIATMILGIGSTTAVFSAMNAILLRPLPFTDSERVVQLESIVRDLEPGNNLAYPDLMDFRRSIPDFSALTVFQPVDATLQQGDSPQFVHGLQVDDRYPDVFEIRASLGRLFTASDADVNAAKVAILSHDFWMRQFGGDRSVVGRIVTLDNESVQIVGVLAEGAYTFPRQHADLLRPLVIYPHSMMVNRGAMWANAAAKLKPGVSLDAAQRDVRSAAKIIETTYSNSNTGITARLAPLHDAVVGSVQSMLQLLGAAVSAVLLIACINIANLILGRAQARSREFAVRSAIGGSPARVRQQIFTESLLLAVIGGVVGIAISPFLTRALVAVYPEALPRADEIGVDGRVLLVAAGATLLAGVLSAMPTARRAASLELAQDLRDGGRSGSAHRERAAGRVLIVSQVAASLALLFGAGLLLQTFWRLTRVDPGFDPRGITTFHVFAPSARYKTARDIDRYYQETITALESIPGVREVSTTTFLPFGGSRFRDVFFREEIGERGPANPSATMAFVEPGFDRALGLQLRRGRGFTASDDSASERVVIVNDALVKRYFDGVDPLGRYIDYNGQKNWRVVAVVASTHIENLWDDPAPVLYVPTRQHPRSSRFVMVRSSLQSGEVLSAARAALRRIDPTIALTDPATMDERIQSSLAPQRFRAAMMATLGALALLLAIIGIYGVVAYTVTRRTREIGIRMALGEAAGAVRTRVVADALRVASTGIVAGVGLALLAGKWLTIFLVDVSPRDPRMLIGASLALAAVVCAAAYGPARRAARVDPVTALRAE